MNARAFGNMSVETAELLHDAPFRPYSAKELKDAKEGIRDDIVAGKTVAGFDLDACFDCEMNENEKFPRELSAFVRQACGPERQMLAYDFGTWAEAIVERHIPENAITERAQANRNDNGEEN